MTFDMETLLPFLLGARVYEHIDITRMVRELKLDFQTKSFVGNERKAT